MRPSRCFRSTDHAGLRDTLDILAGKTCWAVGLGLGYRMLIFDIYFLHFLLHMVLSWMGYRPQSNKSIQCHNKGKIWKNKANTRSWWQTCCHMSKHSTFLTKKEVAGELLRYHGSYGGNSYCFWKFGKFPPKIWINTLQLIPATHQTGMVDRSSKFCKGKCHPVPNAQSKTLVYSRRTIST